MKLALISLFVFTTGVFASVHSQTIRVNIQAHNVATHTVLDEIEKQTDYLFIYNSNEVDLNRKTSVEASNSPVAEVLSDIFNKTDVIYAMEGNNIMLMRRTAAAVTQQTNRKITGTVTDNTGESIIGANVVIKGTTNGTVTDLDGNFMIEAPASGGILQISYIGFLTQEVAIGNQNNYKIQLKSDNQVLDEVVVVGYGTQKKGELTSSITSVKSESFIKGAVQDAAQLLQGKVAGLGVILPNGDPTATTQIMLRGVGTLLSGSAPLVIIDGVPGDLTTVATEDIESIDVVKDGSAAAIYGTRGNNGVIFITTKKAKGEMPLSVDVQAYVTTQQIKKKLNMMDASEYRELVAKGIVGATDYGYDTNWLDEVLRTPVSWVTNASLKGGTQNTNYIANINYKSSQGIVRESDNEVLTSRLEVNHSMWDGLLKFNLNIMGREQKYRMLSERDNTNDGSYKSSFKGEIYRNALINNPTERPKDENGNWIEHTEINQYSNPLALIYESSGEDRSTQLRTFGTVTLTPIRQVYIRALGSRTSYNENQGYAETKKHISTVRDSKNGYASKKTISSLDNMLEITSQYKEQFGKHDVTALLGYSYQNSTYERAAMSNWDFPSDQYTYNNMGAGAALKRGEATQLTQKEENSLIGFFARANYNFDNKYLLSASIRHEGSTKFGADHKWGNFPAFSAGWNIFNESFMESTRNILSTLKVRAGFGVTGTVPFSPYESLSRLGTGDNFYTGDGWIPTIKSESNSNPDLRWERKEEWNLGFDFGFLENRISGSIDLYQRKTKDMLWRYQVAKPPYLYDDVLANAGSMENKGLEISLNFIPVQTKEFVWNTSVNYSTNKNKLLSLSNDRFQLKAGFIDAGNTDEPIQQSTHRLQVGGKVGDFYGYKVIDIDDDGRWVIEDKDGNPKPILQQQPDDKKVIGNGLPKHFLSWTNSFNYKGFNLAINMRGAFGFDILNMPRLYYDNPIFLARGNLLNTAYEPKINGKVLSNKQELQYVSYYVEKGDYWKIDNITLGYTFNLKDAYLKKVNVYFTGNNLFTITGYSGLDPEVNISGLNPGCDTRERYPSTRTFSLGTILTF
ncbi:TonB-dependent receptor [Parabacteroides bouchesdurhonensis]|uniref:TonB-dependent receptor n=1 Tax=Parabacteroides bouchesdurhonensis TaxID=1936995 RepID=UPI000C81D05F|nr:TonB-dependent receptor [Parabacteroides bouchesdurhonensis]